MLVRFCAKCSSSMASFKQVNRHIKYIKCRVNTYSRWANRDYYRYRDTSGQSIDCDKLLGLHNSHIIVRCLCRVYMLCKSCCDFTSLTKPARVFTFTFP